MGVRRAYRRFWQSGMRDGTEVFSLRMAPTEDRELHFLVMVRLEDGSRPCLRHPSGTYKVGRCNADGAWAPEPGRDGLIGEVPRFAEALQELKDLIVVHRVMES
jgi:hypothetical protein